MNTHEHLRQNCIMEFTRVNFIRLVPKMHVYDGTNFSPAKMVPHQALVPESPGRVTRHREIFVSHLIRLDEFRDTSNAAMLHAWES